VKSAVHRVLPAEGVEGALSRCRRWLSDDLDELDDPKVAGDVCFLIADARVGLDQPSQAEQNGGRERIEPIDARAIVNDVEQRGGVPTVYRCHVAKIRRSSYSLNGHLRFRWAAEVFRLRLILGSLVVFLAACGGAEQSPSITPTADATASAEPSVAAEPTASASPETGGLRAWPLDDPEGSASPMGYLEYLPPSYSSEGEPSPLLIFLHGGGEAGDGSAATLDLVAKLGIPQLIADGDWPADHPFIVLAPQFGTVPASDRCDIADDVARFLEFATLSYNVDRARIYLTGISCGAIGIWDYLAAHGDDVAAAALPISGHAEWALEDGGCAPLTEVPVWAFHGAQDETVPTIHIQGPMDKVRDCEGVESAEMELTIYPDADHDAWTRTYDLSAGHDIYAWLLEHTNP
jgi:dienelactone hydrolase